MLEKRNSLVDLCKFILAILVAAIHVRPFEGEFSFFYNDVLARIANPIFFVLSGYFLFSKAYKSGFDMKVLGKYMTRMLLLYFIWLILLFPLIYERTGQLAELLDRNHSLFLIQSIFLRGPYGAMWFLTALLLAMPLTYYIVKYLSLSVALVISTPLYLITVAMTEYSAIFADMAGFRFIDGIISHSFIWYANGLTFGLLFCSLGCLIARLEYNNPQEISKGPLILGTITSAILYVAEAYIVRESELGRGYGASLMMIPLAYYSVRLLCHMDVNYNETFAKACRFLQKISILVFMIHYPVMEFLQKQVKAGSLASMSSSLEYILVLLISICAGAVIILLSNCKRLGWLRYLY